MFRLRALWYWYVDTVTTRPVTAWQWVQWSVLTGTTFALCVLVGMLLTWV